ncbi:hypothetical protein FKM82_022445 [Ascaphus truei]
MGNLHTTHVSNGYGSNVLVVGTHSNGQSTETILTHMEVQTVKTAAGTITISVYNPQHYNYFEPLNRITVPSNVNVTIAKSDDGKPEILRVNFGSFWTPDPFNYEKIEPTSF